MSKKIVMKSIIVVISIFIFLLMILVIKNQNDKRIKNYEKFVSADEGATVEWNGITYEAYGSLHNYELTGNQLGIVDDDPLWKIYEFKELSNREWIIEHYDVIMNTRSIYKAVGVKEIPDIIKDRYLKKY